MHNGKNNTLGELNFAQACAKSLYIEIPIILILVVLIALVIIFREQLTELVGNIFSSINSKAGTIYS